MRILSPDQIPRSLWAEEILRLPSDLVQAYKDQLACEGLLLAAATKPGKKEIHGGPSVAESDEHFAHRFSNSSARAEFVTLSPDPNLGPVSDALLSTFSEGPVALLDIPCGTGAATSTLLTTLAVLRSENVMPRLPLSISITGGDLSPSAMSIYEGMLERLRPTLRLAGIEIDFCGVEWDANLGDQTSKLVDRWFEQSEGAEEFVVCVSNFSGALSAAAAMEKFSPCFNQIVARLYNKAATVVWLEPDSQAQRKVFKFLTDYLHVFLPSFFGAGPLDSTLSAKYKTEDPITSKVYSSAVSVLKFRRTSG